MKLLYFASVRDALGVDSEDVAVPGHVRTVAELAAFLAQRGDAYATVFSGDSLATLRAAVDLTHAKPGDSIAGAVEVAFFPPVTGG